MASLLDLLLADGRGPVGDLVGIRIIRLSAFLFPFFKRSIPVRNKIPHQMEILIKLRTKTGISKTEVKVGTG